MNAQDKGFIALISRSPDIGDGWRQVSEMLWPMVKKFSAQDLIEVDAKTMRVRLNSDGAAVSRHLVATQPERDGRGDGK